VGDEHLVEQIVVVPGEVYGRGALLEGADHAVNRCC